MAVMHIQLEIQLFGFTGSSVVAEEVLCLVNTLVKAMKSVLQTRHLSSQLSQWQELVILTNCQTRPWSRGQLIHHDKMYTKGSNKKMCMGGVWPAKLQGECNWPHASTVKPRHSKRGQTSEQRTNPKYHIAPNFWGLKFCDFREIEMNHENFIHGNF